MLGLCIAAATSEAATAPSQPGSLTNLIQLRHCAEQEAAVHSFQIIADVCDADGGAGVLALRDASGVEFIRLNPWGRKIEPGARVCLEGKHCAIKLNSFGLAIVPGFVVDNDNLHPDRTESGSVFLHSGLNPISVEWFNGPGDCSLNVEYEGPGLPRQKPPDSVLSRATVEPATGKTNFSAGLDYRCYEGAWDQLPDFTKLRPLKTGVATNFDLNVRTRNEYVGLRFDGFINIPQDGQYTFHVASDDGSRLFVGESVNVRVLDDHLASPALEKTPAASPAANLQGWVTIEGTVNFASVWETGGALQMLVGDDDVRVELFESGGLAPDFSSHTRMRISGVYQDVNAVDGRRVPGILRTLNWQAVRPAPTSEKYPAKAMNVGDTNRMAAAAVVSAATPITTAAKIKALSPEAADRQLPVSIRGVVTYLYARNAVIQDSTKGIFVGNLPVAKNFEPLRVGELCQIDGVTGPGLFAPLVVAGQITHLGAGQFPKPQHATRDQLMSGSMETEYAEIEGVVTAIHNRQAELLMEGGKVTLDLRDLRPEVLARCKNAWVQIRGCVFSPFNEQTRRLESGKFYIGSSAVNFLKPAPCDPFDAPSKSISDLLLYDPKAEPFRLLKISGQVIHGQAGEYFLTDGTNGVLATTENPPQISVGDLVDAVGFLEPGGAMVEMKEAMMRKTGHAPLPAPIKLSSGHLLQAIYAGALVQVDATLMNLWREGSEQVLEFQSGFLAFKARVNSDARRMDLPPAGSRVELTGVHVPQGHHAADGTVSGFELLLNSPAGIRVLATPPWWNLKRVFILAGIFAVLLLAVLVWNKELQRKVQERTRELKAEIHNRQQAEQQRAAEAERARIARDLHDDLGSGLTAVSLLASAGLGEFGDTKKLTDRLRVIGDKARALLSALDVIVWAIDPRHNSLQSFADYLRIYASENLSNANIACRFRIPIECNPVTLTGGSRHSLFLAVKETLNNVIRHASATEVELQMGQFEDRLEIVIADNGCGFDWNASRRGHGLANLQERLETLHGQCQIESQPGKGTTVRFTVPLLRNVAAS